MYYVCNSAQPLEGPLTTITSRVHELFEEACAEAVEQAKKANGLSWYVHEFGPSKVVYRASSVITVETEMINDTPPSE